MNSTKNEVVAGPNGFSAMQEKSIVVAGTKLRYFAAGTRHPGGSTLVLVHGAGGSTQTHYGYLMPMLARRHHVLSVDMASPNGLGQTELTLEHLAQQVVAAIENEALDAPVALLGYSLGAVVAAYVAGTRPELVDRLILINGWMRTDQQQVLRNNIWRVLRAEGSSALKDFMAFCAISGGFMNFMLPAELSGAANGFRLDDFLDQQMDLTRRVDISNSVPSIIAPTLVVGSRDDQMAPPRHGKALFGAIDDARYYEVASGHAVLHERTAEILRVAENFLMDPHRYSAGTVIEPLHP